MDQGHHVQVTLHVLNSQLLPVESAHDMNQKRCPIPMHHDHEVLLSITQMC